MKKLTRAQLEKMTREQKLLYYDLREERKKRDREKRDIFSPNEGQLPVLKSRKRERFVISGNGSGKTALATNAALYALQGYQPHWDSFTTVPAKVIVVLDSPDKVAETWLPELRKWANIEDDQLEKQGKPYYTKVGWANGSYIQFMFHDQAPMKFESIEADCIIFDEPPPKHVYTALKRGLRKKGTQPWILCIGTPITGGWIRSDLYVPWSKGERPDIEFFQFSTDVNKANLADGYIEWYFGNLSEKERKIRREGMFFDLDGLALVHLFDRSHHIKEPDDINWDFDANPCVIAVDPHTSKKHHAVLLGADNDGHLYYLDEYTAKLTGTEFAQALIKQDWFDFNVIDIVYDSAGNADGTSGESFYSFGDRFNKELQRQNLGPARATTFNEKNDEDFIERIRGVLSIQDGDSQLKISSHCRGIISDIENVQWARHKLIDENKPKLDIQNKDYLACLKYALATNLYFDKAKKKRVYRLKEMPAGYVGDRHVKQARAAKIRRGLKKWIR